MFGYSKFGCDFWGCANRKRGNWFAHYRQSRPCPRKSPTHRQSSLVTRLQQWGMVFCCVGRKGDIALQEVIMGQFLLAKREIRAPPYNIHWRVHWPSKFDLVWTSSLNETVRVRRHQVYPYCVALLLLL